MKSFIYKTAILTALALMCFFFVCQVISLLGLSDWAYKRFTVERKRSLIVGTSRSAQGIQPSVINASMEGQYAEIYNFSFTVADSPYGEIYYDAIKEMVDERSETGKGLFVMSVDPWGLSMMKPLDDDGLREEHSCLNEVKVLHQRPNFLYLALNFQLHNLDWFQLWMNLQDDGLLRVDFDMANADTVANINQRLLTYEGYEMEKSTYRMQWLEKTVDLLKQYGDVYMCRVPVHPGMLSIENQKWPSFDEEMQAVSVRKQIPYISFSNRAGFYRTTDGNHLYKEDASVFTRELCDSILSCRSVKP